MLLHIGPLSLFSRKVEIALIEKGLAYERVVVAFSQTKGYAPKHPAVLAANPKGQVPVLADGDLVLYDSTVILEYLEEAYPAPALYPSGAKARARCRQLELFADEVLLDPVRKLMHRTEQPGDPAKRAAQEEAARAAEPRILDLYGELEAALGDQDHLCGALSVADIANFMTLHWSLRLAGPPLAAHPRLAAWRARLLARPAFTRIVAEIAAADRELSHPVAPR